MRNPGPLCDGRRRDGVGALLERDLRGRRDRPEPANLAQESLYATGVGVWGSYLGIPFGGRGEAVAPRLADQQAALRGNVHGILKSWESGYERPDSPEGENYSAA